MSKSKELHNPEEVWGQVKENPEQHWLCRCEIKGQTSTTVLGETRSSEIILQLKAINPYNKFIPVLTLLQYDIAEEYYYFCPT